MQIPGHMTLGEKEEFARLRTDFRRLAAENKRLREQLRWRKCGEEMPANNTMNWLVACRDERFPADHPDGWWFGWADFFENEWAIDEPEIDSGKITHWRPITPPEVEH